MVRGLGVMRGRYADEVIWGLYGRVEEAMLLALVLDEIKSRIIALVVLVMMMILLGQVFRDTCWCCRSWI
jgi:hypothetical protein